MEQLADGATKHQRVWEQKLSGWVGREGGLSSFSPCLHVSVRDACVHESDICRALSVLDKAAYVGPCLNHLLK